MRVTSAHRYICWIVLLLCVLIPQTGRTAALQSKDAPVVLKVEPPNWWVNHSLNPVRLLVRGRNLGGASIQSTNAGLKIGPTRINEAGTYLFTDVLIARNLAPGQFPLEITTTNGKVRFPFEILAPMSREGRFQGFSQDDVIYLLMPDRFADGDPQNDDPEISHGLFNRQKPRYYHGGDLQGVIDHLPYLKDLGVTAIWMNPVYDNVNHLNQREKYDNEAITDYHGYGAVDYYSVEEHFGDTNQLRELVESAHQLGIKVIQDQVANHTGPYHPWVEDPPTPTWYHGTESSHLNETWQVWTLIDPHATSQMQEPTLNGWFVNILPDLNQEDDEVARYTIQNTLWWIGMTGMDGIRQDTLPYVSRHFWHEWMTAIKREYPNLKVVGEMWDQDPGVVSFFQGGATRFDGVDSLIDTLFDFPFYYSIRGAFAQGKPLLDIAGVLSRDYLYVNPNTLVTFLGSHDVARFANEPGATVGGMKLAYTLLMTARGIPMIYYGDEIAMKGGNDPDNRKDFPGGWIDDPRNAFERAGRTEEEDAVFSHVRKLTHLRAQLEPLRRGKMVNLAVGEQTWAFARTTDKTSVIVIINNDFKPAEIHFLIGPVGLSDGTKLRDFLGVIPDTVVTNGQVRTRLPARSASVISTLPVP